MRFLPAIAVGFALLVGGFAGTGCQKEAVKATAPAAEATGPKAVVPAGFVLVKAPEAAKDLAAVKTEAKDGDEVVARCIIGGSEKPFTADSAVVQVMDPAVMTCDKMGMSKDACPTPWDACCHQDDAKARGAMVKVLDAAGKPVAGTLQGVGGMKPGAEVVIKGKARVEAGKGLVIDATAVFVKG